MRAMPKRLLSMLSVLAMLMTMLSVLPVSADDSDTQLQDMALIKSRFAAYFLTLSMDKRYGDETQAEAYLDTSVRMVRGRISIITTKRIPPTA